MKNSLEIYIKDIKLELEKIKKEREELYKRIELLKMEKKTIMQQIKNQNNFNSLNEVGYLKEKVSFLHKEVENCIKLMDKI